MTSAYRAQPCFMRDILFREKGVGVVSSEERGWGETESAGMRMRERARASLLAVGVRICACFLLCVA